MVDDRTPPSRPWFLRPWGAVLLAYVAITATLGIVFLAVSRGTTPRTAAIPEEFTAAARDGIARVPDPTTAAVPIVTADAPVLGSVAAPLTIVEFSDFQCPFCKRAFPIVREVAAQYGDRVRFLYRDFPIEEIHTDARRAAEAGKCAHAQGKFWAFHDKLFQRQEALDAASLRQYAREIGLDGEAFDRCLDAGTFADAVQEDLVAGKRLGVRGTPTWFIVFGSDERQAQKVEGVIPRERLIEVIERELPR